MSLNHKKIIEGIENEYKELIQFNNLEAKKYLQEQEKIIFQNLDVLPNEMCKKYLFLINNSEMLISLYKLKESKQLRNNDYFGDFLYGKYIHYVESIQDKLYLLMIKNNVFKEFSNNEKSEFTYDTNNFLVDNFFFNSIKKTIFGNYYLNLFEKEHYKLGQKICNENDLVENVFFIKEGKVKLFTKKSVLEIHMLINIIKELVKKKKLDEDTDIDYCNQEKNICNFISNHMLKCSEEKDYYDELKNNIYNMKKEINIKQKKHLINYQENQCIGFESLYYGLKYLYTAVANTEKVEIYKISKERLIKIFLDKNEKSFLEFSKKAEKDILFLNQRFINLNNFMLKFYDRKKTFENKNNFSLSIQEERINKNYKKLFLF